MEDLTIFTLEHPTRGLLEFIVGPVDQLRQLDDQWPAKVPDDASDKSEKKKKKRKKQPDSNEHSGGSSAVDTHSDTSGEDANGEAGDDLSDSAKLEQQAAHMSRQVRERVWNRTRSIPLVRNENGKVGSLLSRWNDAGHCGMLVQSKRTKSDGQSAVKTLLRTEQIKSGKFSIANKVRAGAYSSPGGLRKSGDFLDVEVGLTGEVMAVHLHEKAKPGTTTNQSASSKDWDVYPFIPPEGTPASRRYHAVQKSPWKGVFYSVISGVGKSTWAIFAFFALPIIFRIIGRIIDWILSFLPDFDIPLPDIPWPHINFPSIPWPHIHLPSIPWPHFNLPHIPLPSIDLPEWLIFLIDHPKMWIPLLIAIFLGIGAFKRARRARRTQEKQGSRHTPSVHTVEGKQESTDHKQRMKTGQTDNPTEDKEERARDTRRVPRNETSQRNDED